MDRKKSAFGNIEFDEEQLEEISECLFISSYISKEPIDDIQLHQKWIELPDSEKVKYYRMGEFVIFNYFPAGISSEVCDVCRDLIEPNTPHYAVEEMIEVRDDKGDVKIIGESVIVELRCLKCIDDRIREVLKKELLSLKG